MNRASQENATVQSRTIPVTFEACEARPYHFSGHIQPHGAFFSIDRATLQILHVSDNIHLHFGLKGHLLLGTHFGDLLTASSASDITALAFKHFATRESLVLSFKPLGGFRADSLLYQDMTRLVIELEPPGSTGADLSEKPVSSWDFFALLERIGSSDVPSANLPRIVCEAIREVTGFDRVYYCEFDAVGQGHVIGESRNDVLPILLDHRFPATDIPQVARKMFLINPFRMIPDIDAEEVPIIGEDSTLLDLGMSTYRAVAPSHLAYMRNMGVTASLSFPVAENEHLAGIFGGHHAGPRYLSLRQLATCRHLVELFKTRGRLLRICEERETLSERLKAVYSLSLDFQTADRDLGAFIAANHQRLRDLMDADDVICRFEGRVHFGSGISELKATKLLKLLDHKLAAGRDFFQSNRIGADDPEFASFCPEVAGMFGVSLDLRGTNVIAWLRREVVVVEKWAGDPHCAVTNEHPIGPRASFLAYRREVKGTSEIWPAVSADLGRQLRQAFAQVLASHYETDQWKIAQHERITLATDSGRIGIWDFDAKDNRLAWDAWMYRLYGMAPGDDTDASRLWQEHLHPDDRAAAEQAMNDALSGLRAFDTEFRVVWDDGSLHFLRGIGRVTLDPLKNPIRMVGVSWDVTEPRCLAAELSRQIERQTEAAERENAFFRNSPDVLYVVGVKHGAEGVVSFVYEAFSPALPSVTGWNAEHLVGRTPDECLPKQEGLAALNDFRSCVDRGATLTYARTFATPLGRRDYEGSVTPVPHSGTGQIVRLVGSLRDVTERNQLQAALQHSQKMIAIGRLAAGVAHDFNNILQSIVSGLELVLDGLDPDCTAHRFAALGLASAKRGSHLTHHLLSYARKQFLHPSFIELPLLLPDIEKMLGRMLGPQIVIQTRIDPTVQGVIADASQLETALLNLAINSLHAMPSGGELIIEAVNTVEDGIKWVCLSVTDTGTGMDETTLAQAVEPFYTTKGVLGTGLGLSMIQGFLEQSGGRLKITSTLMLGTRVEMYLPSAASKMLEKAEQPAEATNTDYSILFVDDDPQILATTGAYLGMMGYNVICEDNGKKALARLAERVIDAVVTDYAMPGLNGAEFIDQARVIRPGLPAVLISGFVDLAETKTLPQNILMLHKPFQRQDLVDAIKQVLSRALPAERYKQKRTRSATLGSKSRYRRKLAKVGP